MPGRLSTLAPGFFILKIMENQITITIEGENKEKSFIADIILIQLKKNFDLRNKVIVFNSKKTIHPATENADILIQVL